MIPQDFQNLAEILSKSSEPAHLRSAVSRAYYAVYNSAAEMLTSLGFPVTKSSSGHGEVMRKLSNAGNPDVMKAGADVGNLEGARLDADYRLQRP